MCFVLCFHTNSIVVYRRFCVLHFIPVITNNFYFGLFVYVSLSSMQDKKIIRWSLRKYRDFQLLYHFQHGSIAAMLKEKNKTHFQFVLKFYSSLHPSVDLLHFNVIFNNSFSILFVVDILCCSHLLILSTIKIESN